MLQMLTLRDCPEEEVMADRLRTSSLSRWILRLASVVLTLGIIAGAGAAVFFGAGSLADRADAREAPAPSPPVSVDVSPLREEESYTVTRRFIGQVEAAREIELSFELGGRLMTLGVEEGDSVYLGQTIATLDTDLLQAEKDSLLASRNAVSAQLDFAELRLERAASLNTRGFASQERLDEAQSARDELQARVAEIDAGLARIEISLDKSNVQSPFDGTVGARQVDPGVTLSPGQPVVSITAAEAPTIRVGLPLDIDLDRLGTVEFEIGDGSFAAHRRSVRPDIDPVTRTRTVIFELNSQQQMVFGRTAVLHLNIEISSTGTWLPISALREGDRGTWTVYVVDEGIVRNALVELIHATADRVFVRGTFNDGALLVQTGAHRLVPGQTVVTNLVED